MTPLPAVLALQNSRVHVRSSDHSNVIANIKTPVDKYFSVLATLYVPYINPDYCHVRFWGNLDYSQFRCKCDIVKDVVLS